MTARKKPAPTEIGLTARQLFDAVTLVKPFVGTDDTLPMLRGYQFEVHGGDLYVAGTDRYSLAIARVEPDSDQTFPAGFKAFLPSSLATRALTLFKPARKPVFPEPLLLTVHGNRVAIENVPSDEGEPSTRLVGDEFNGQFPSHRSMCTTTLAAVREADHSGARIARTGMNPAYLARFEVVHKVMGRHVNVTMRQAAHNKPVVITAGDQFFGMQMPVREFDGEQDEFAAWFNRFDVPPVIVPEPVKAAPKARARRAKAS